MPQPAAFRPPLRSQSHRVTRTGCKEKKCISMPTETGHGSVVMARGLWSNTGCYLPNFGLL